MSRIKGRVLKTEMQEKPERLRLKIHTKNDGTFWATYFGREDESIDKLAAKEDITVGDIIAFGVELGGENNDLINIHKVVIEHSVPLQNVAEIEKIGEYDSEDEKLNDLKREISGLRKQVSELRRVIEERG